MNKYVSPIIEIENIAVERIMDLGFSNENDIPAEDDLDVPMPGGGGNSSGTPGGDNQWPGIPLSLRRYYNK